MRRPREKKFRPVKEKDEGKSNGYRIALWTVVALLVVGITALTVCWFYYKWEWSKVAYWLNPFSEGNNVAWLVYASLVILAMAIAWLVFEDHRERGV